MRVLSVNLGLPREVIWRGKRSRSGSTRSRSPDFGPGTFGENLTTEGLLDGDVSVGDRFRVGTAELVVTQPRLPCFKLGIRWATTSS